MYKVNKPTVALLFGGQGREHDVSRKGAEYLMSLIDRNKYILLPVFISKAGEWFIKDDFSAGGKDPLDPAKFTARVSLAPARAGRIGAISAPFGEISVHCAFPLLHGDYGEDGRIQGALDTAHIPYVGCGVICGAVTADKAYTKMIAEALGIPTARWTLTVCEGAGDEEVAAKENCERLFGYPMFVKPARLGSSVGASAVHCPEEFHTAFALAAAEGDGRILIEELVSTDRELECAYLRVDGREMISAPGEIICNGGFYSYERKYLGEDGAVATPEGGVSDSECAALKKHISTLAKMLGIKDLARFDFFKTTDGRLLFNEINTMPGFTESSLYPKLVAEFGISPTQLTELLIQSAISPDC